ncbi:MAG: peptidylprolyl isomerase [Bryobacterales bacterium]|jgi:peptidyl-prolyl cis-trans isomerase D|nr:peptidylprolyl isomerase [Bryobacterales bacterium]
MFDLFRSRAKAVRILLGAILTVVAAAMVITLIPGFGGAEFGASAQTLAEVAGEPITVNQLRASIAQLARGTDMTQDRISAMMPVAFRNLVQERALLYEANRLGFSVSDDDLVDAIRSIPGLHRNGQFVGADEYRMLLEQNGSTPAQFEADLRRELTRSRLSAMIARTVVVGEQEVDDVLKERNEKVAVQYLYLEPKGLEAQITPTPEEIDVFYSRAENKVRIPEQRDFDIIRFSMERALEASPIPMSEIKAYYDANIDQYRLEEQARLRHILLSTEGKTDEQKAEIRKQAEALLQQLKGGADFAKLAREKSTDQVSAKEGGDLGWIFRGQTEPPFEAAAFALKPGSLSDVVETTYGFHIIQSEGFEPPRVRPVDTVRDEIAGQLSQQRALNLMQQTADRLRNQVQANPKNAETIAKAEPLAQFLQYNQVPNASPAGSIAPNSQLRQDMNSLAEGQVTAVGEAGGNALAFAVVRSVQPDREATKEEAMDRTIALIKAQNARLLTMRKLSEAKEAIDGGADIRTVGRNMGLTFGEAPPFTRISAAEGIGNVGDIYKAFDVPVGGTLEPFQSGPRWFVVKVTGREEANLAALASERVEARKALINMKSQERLQLYLEGVRARLEREGKIKIDSQRVTALMQNGPSL